MIRAPSGDSLADGNFEETDSGLVPLSGRHPESLLRLVEQQDRRLALREDFRRDLEHGVQGRAEGTGLARHVRDPVQGAQLIDTLTQRHLGLKRQDTECGVCAQHGKQLLVLGGERVQALGLDVDDASHAVSDDEWYCEVRLRLLQS